MPHPSATALNLLGSATLHETILIIVRAFDDAGRLGATRSNRVSFPVMHDLMRLPDVLNLLEKNARDWFDGHNADQNADTFHRYRRNFEERLSRLRKERPNRLEMLRNFRDEFLAHNLDVDEVRERPQFRHVTEIIEEMTELSNDAQLIFRGSDVTWELLDEKIRESASALWEAIDRGSD